MVTKGADLELAQAQKIADSVVARFRPQCSVIEIAGSIRRRRPLVHDIDIVLIPNSPYALDRVLMEMAIEEGGTPRDIKGGSSVSRLRHQRFMLDIYKATPTTFPTLLLIRTGSKRHNIYLAARAKQKGWHLHANGDGLFNADGERVAGDTEESIFEALGLHYVEPELRE